MIEKGIQPVNSRAQRESFTDWEKAQNTAANTASQLPYTLKLVSNPLVNALGLSMLTLGGVQIVEIATNSDSVYAQTAPAKDKNGIPVPRKNNGENCGLEIVYRSNRASGRNEITIEGGKNILVTTDNKGEGVFAPVNFDNFVKYDRPVKHTQDPTKTLTLHVLRFFTKTDGKTAKAQYKNLDNGSIGASGEPMEVSLNCNIPELQIITERVRQDNQPAEKPAGARQFIEGQPPKDPTPDARTIALRDALSKVEPRPTPVPVASPRPNPQPSSTPVEGKAADQGQKDSPAAQEPSGWEKFQVWAGEHKREIIIGSAILLVLGSAGIYREARIRQGRPALWNVRGKRII